MYIGLMYVLLVGICFCLGHRHPRQMFDDSLHNVIILIHGQRLPVRREVHHQRATPFQMLQLSRVH